MIDPLMWRDALMIFYGIFVEAAPFIFLGVVISSVLHAFVSDALLLRMFPKNVLGKILVGCGLGFLFPVCECGNIPVARRLMVKGVPPYAAIAFLLSAPVFNPVVILATWTAFRTQPEMLYLRVAGTITVAILVALLFSKATKEEILREEVYEEMHTPHTHTGSKGNLFFSTLIKEFFEMGSVLVLGAFVAALSHAIMPRQLIVKIGQGPILSVFAMIALAIIISICSTVDSFFALGYSSTFTQASLLAFLIYGPMVDIKALFMLGTVFRIRAIVIMTVVALQLVLAMTLFMNLHIS